jgi:hypothetical protein
MFEQFQNAFEQWRLECVMIDREMDRLFRLGFSNSEDERRGRRFQFASLLERRRVAARNLLAGGH